MAERVYAVWVKGRRLGTERRFVAATRDEAIWQAHYQFQCRTIDLDAQWLRDLKESA